MNGRIPVFQEVVIGDNVFVTVAATFAPCKAIATVTSTVVVPS